MDIIKLLFGFFALIYGANLFVDGSISVAKLLRIPSIIIGLTIVAMGTSTPEAAVSMLAALKHTNEIAYGNVVGSNIFNILIVLGFAALVRYVPVDRKVIKKDYLFCVFVSLLLVVVTVSGRDISRIDGIILVALMGIYLLISIKDALGGSRDDSKEDKIKISFNIMEPNSKYTLNKSNPIISVILIVFGLSLIIGGGNFVVESASNIAALFGISQKLIGLTIVAIGTSLPELVTSVVASIKGDSGIAVGNVIGSNIFNILFVLGFSAVLSPIPVDISYMLDLVVMIIATLLVFVFSYTGNKINKKEAFIAIVIYIIYMYYSIMRGIL